MTLNDKGLAPDVSKAIEIVLSATPEQLKEILKILYS